MNLIKLAPLAALAVAVACAEQGSVGPAGDASFSHVSGPGEPARVGHWTLCKVGSDAIFSVEVNGVAVADIPVSNGACAEVDSSPIGGGAIVVKATEQAAANTVVDSIVIDSVLITGATGSAQITGTDNVTRTANGDKGIVATFYNTFTPPPPPGDEGCTPGFWRNWSANAPGNQSDQWVTYSVGDSYNTVFGVSSSLGTLYDAVTAKGGGANALGRHSVAALLNASSSVNAVFTEAQVIAIVQAAYASGDFNGAADLLAAANELGCPLP